MKKQCQQCGCEFEIDQQDQRFFEKISPAFNGKKYLVPAPSKCPDCRMRQRLMFRNFFKLYNLRSDLSQKQIISMYDQDSPFPKYEMNEWWGDQWDALDYGFKVDFNKSIFDQMKVLHKTVPRMSIVNTLSENTEYCNLSILSKNCYLVFGNVENEDCYYGHIVWQCKNCFDCLYTYRSELCFECTDCVGCYDLAFSLASENCSNSRFLIDCISCKDCFGCVGLRNKQYHIFNKAYSEEEYLKKLKEFNLGSYEMAQSIKKQVLDLLLGVVVKNFHGFNCENVEGDYLYYCRNVFDSYDMKNCEDCRYCATVESFFDSYDCNYSPSKSELSYNCVAIVGYNILMSHNAMNNCSYVIYCDNCYACKHCFGCCGLKNKQYCIFNKQYTKDEYEDLLPRLIKKMEEEGEWGNYFPMDFSPFAYNETMAQEYFPMEKEAVLKAGLRWKDDNFENKYKGPDYQIPDHIDDVPDEICDRILICEVMNKPYKIIKPELNFYRKMKIPIPRRCWEQRHKDRMGLRNPRKLWDRQCARCQKAIKTTFKEGRPEKVYCEQCYLEEL